jgi:hypothetical protein
MNRQKTTLCRVPATVDVTIVEIPPVVVTVVDRASDRDPLAGAPTLPDAIIVSTAKIAAIVIRTTIATTIAVTAPTREEALVQMLSHLPCTTGMRVQSFMALLRYRITTETIEAGIPRGVQMI